ncbi:MAG: hypothetical protein PHP85_09855 [Gallionella sp.]|nr:hypothetical protein [Gallionella sp.]
MKNILHTPGSGWGSALRKTIAVLALAGFGTGGALAAPLAGTTIGNQASATYTDASLIGRNATSNTVTTIVQQVAAFTLTASQSKSSAPGAPISFAHTVTNNGNGTDSFSLTAVVTGGAFAVTSAQYFIDANCDGIADNATPITSVNNVAAGASACFIATGTVPALAANGTSGTMTVAAASVLTPATVGVTNPNTDTITVTAQAVVTITKSISIPSGPAGTTPVTYTLTYTNTGNTAATGVILADFLPANMAYIAGTAKLNGVALVDSATAADGLTAATTFDFGLTLAGRATAIITSLASGQSGTLSFNVTVSAAAAPGQINNQARLCYNDGAAMQPVVGCTSANTATSSVAGSGTPSNTATFTVLQTAGVAANELLANTTIGGVSDTVTVASASQGATVTFNDYVHNNGNGTDTFNVTLSAGSFPLGTTFVLYKSDGVTPLTDTNAIPDGVVDTGPVAANSAYLVVVKATLPSGVSGGGAYANVLTARSSFNPTGLIGVGFDTVNNSLTTITANTVDLTTGAPVATATVGALGLGAGATSTPSVLSSVVGGVVSQAPVVNPGATVTYPLYVNNTSAIADTYAVTSTALPAGWSVVFVADGGAGNCTTLGATVTNTGVINAGANTLICAVVTTAATGATAAPGATAITFTATSPTTAASDFKPESVTLNTVRSITVTPPNNGQVFPGGSVVYSHTLTNTGNVTEGAGAAGSVITLTDPMTGVVAGWNNIVYWDSNNNGILDATDLVVSTVALNTLTGSTTGGRVVAVNGGFLPGESIRLFVKVLAAASAAAGDINTSSLTATTTGLINTIAAPGAVVAADTSTVIVGQVILAKTQALDAACAGNFAGAVFSNAPIGAGAVPGACILYKVTATNVGTQPVNTVVVSDATPANTLYKSFAGANGVIPAAATTVGALAAFPVDATAATISANLGTLAPGASAVITFGVQINP